MSHTPPDSAAPITKDMGFTPGEILRLLPRALEGWDYAVEGAGAAFGNAEKGGRMTWRELPARRLGLNFVVPRCQVELRLHGLNQAEQSAFLLQFDRSYQRGGG